MKKNKYFFILSCVLLLALACKNKDAAANKSNASTGNPVIDALNQQLEKEERNDKLYAKRASEYYKVEDFDNAIKDYAHALALDSMNIDYHHQLADVYIDAGKSRLALATMQRVAALYPQRIPTLLKLAEFQLILKMNDESLKTAHKVMLLDPQNSEGFFMEGMNLKEMGEKDRAILAFKSAAENDAENQDAWLNLGVLYIEKKDPIALKYIDNALRLDSTSMLALDAKAKFYQNKNDSKNAMLYYKKIVKFHPLDADALCNIGNICLKNNDLNEAYNNFNIAAQADPMHVSSYYYRGLASEKKGDIKAAQKDYQQAINLYPNFEDAKNGLERLKGK